MASAPPGETSARGAIRALTGDFHELPDAPASYDPLAWPGYATALEAARSRTGETESVVAGPAMVQGKPAMLIAFDFGFLGGSMGEATGQRIVRALRMARAERQPVVSLLASGGARVQEGMLALVQMQRIAAELAENRRRGIFHLAVLRNPTTGGVWASLGAAADVILALDGAAVGFAGHRVRDATGSADAFTAEGKHASGFADGVVAHHELPEAVGAWLALLSEVPRPRPCPPPAALSDGQWGRSPWEVVLGTRDQSLPRAPAYLDAYFESRMPLSGDRCGGVDPSMLCGVGRRGDQVAVYVAQTGVANEPAGFRTAHRAFELAERLGLPVLTLVDTGGARNDAAAEGEGVGTAIAELLVKLASLTVPVTTLVVGQGGSGGALAIASPENLWMVPTSYFSVIAPEGAAAILLRDGGRAEEIAERLCLTPEELVRLGVARGVVPMAEPRGP